MGLDISAYSKIEELKPILDAKGRAKQKKRRADFRLWEQEEVQKDNLEPGEYIIKGQGHSFRAGSYGGYNHWRRELCQAVHGVSDEFFWNNLQGYVGRPFYELINFSDCEGYIGPETSKKLYNDFVENEGRILNHFVNLESSDSDWFIQKYHDWKEAFRLASDEGIVVFC